LPAEAPARRFAPGARVYVCALLTAVAAGIVAFAPGGTSSAFALSLLPAVFILLEFTGSRIALAIAAVTLFGVEVLLGAGLHQLMLTASCAWPAAHMLRAGWPSIAPVLLLACGTLGANALHGAAGQPLVSPHGIACALLYAWFGVALATLPFMLRVARRACLPPLRRWSFEDVVVPLFAVALLPAAMALAGREAVAAAAWWTITCGIAVLVSVSVVSIAAGRTIRGLRLLLRDGRVRSGRQRSTHLPREIAQLFLAARRVSDHLHRRTAVQGLQVESAKLRAVRLQQQYAAIERERRGKDLELQRAAAAAAEIDRRWRVFLDALPEALFIVDPCGKIEYVNEGVRQLLGHDPHKLTGTRITALIPATQSELDFDDERKVTTAERQVRFSDSHGALRPLSARMQLFQFSEGARWSVRLRESFGPLQRARDRFVANMSHEIRTPLHGLMATLDMLRSETLSPEGTHRLAISRTSAKALIRIANDILDLSRISVGGMPIERKPMSIEHLVNDLLDEARARDEALRLEINTAIGREVPPAVLGDPLRIKQVLWNLVSNSLKFTTAGSVTVSASWSAGNCVIDVADTGAGIPIEQRESVFEAFVQADGAGSRRQGGAGLGLAIARQLAEAMGGSLSLLQSGPHGSTFRLVLPLAQTDEMPPDEQSQRNLQAVKGRILVAEDDEASRYVAQTLLESLGCPARIVSNGVEALELLRSEEFDLALLDCQMPGMDGYEVTSLLRKAGGRHIPIIAMTASTLAADRQRCFDVGMDDLLSKPFGRSALNDMLARWLNPQPVDSAQVPMAREIAMRPELDTEVFDELRQSLNWQVPPLRKVYSSVRESAQTAVRAMDGGAPANLELALRRLHALQGGAGLVGARQIEYVSARLSQALKLERPLEVSEGMSLLVDSLGRFDKAIESRLDSLSGR
jgi:PAS domain S-box-containing protein